MATQTTTFYTPQQQLHMDAFEWWSKKNHGFVVDYVYIDTTALTKHIRHEARAYLGEITINDHQASEIWNELQNCRATYLEHSIIVRAEVFLTVLATVVEI
ncbi:hypothetical protein [Corynebacterium pseudogenitalium]|uniref:Uncharacterized protein n=1 Tax=Corynebacterium pseudogenitalium ATCC 33035 TaxID=525264 RepID=E2S794_9CORY|nr:hypothetical protein [Corynebacterium pseudogenitalium]EFQ79382.1 hypothetical protein HMPREF0305_12396 [Corynebacterium pseudogenitalium ATCC 33035]